MGKHKNLIQSLFKGGKFHQKVYDELLAANIHVVKALMMELTTNADPDIKETCAEILSDYGKARAIPSLMEALKDDSLQVRQDSLWAIGKLSGFEPSGFESLLDISNTDSPLKLYKKVSVWWECNKGFIINNPNLW